VQVRNGREDAHGDPTTDDGLGLQRMDLFPTFYFLPVRLDLPQELLLWLQYALLAVPH
jgi:hypothetical protein